MLAFRERRGGDGQPFGSEAFEDSASWQHITLVLRC